MAADDGTKGMVSDFARRRPDVFPGRLCAYTSRLAVFLRSVVLSRSLCSRVAPLEFYHAPPLNLLTSPAAVAMLSAAWANRLAVPSHVDHAALVVVSDSQLEPALLVLRHFVHSALLPAATPAAAATARPRASRPPHGSEQNVLLVCFEQAPERLLPPAGTFEPNRVEVVDASLAGPYLALPGQAPRAASRSRVRTQQVDLSGSNGTRHLTDAVANAVGRLSSAGTGGGAPRPVTVVIDSVNVLAEEARGGNGEALRAVKRIWEGLRGRRKGMLSSQKCSLIRSLTGGVSYRLSLDCGPPR